MIRELRDLRCPYCRGPVGVIEDLNNIVPDTYVPIIECEGVDCRARWDAAGRAEEGSHQ